MVRLRFLFPEPLLELHLQGPLHPLEHASLWEGHPPHGQLKKSGTDPRETQHTAQQRVLGLVPQARGLLLLSEEMLAQPQSLGPRTH